MFLNFYLLQKTKASQDKGVSVLEVLDGDTLLLDNKTKLRLRHIDAPELNFCGGVQAKEILANLVKNKKVIVAEEIPDQYGRGMALVYLGGTLINQELLVSGWARYHSDTTSKEQILKEVADTVKKEKKSLVRNYF